MQEDEADDEDGTNGVEDIEGNQWQEHHLAAFAGFRISENSSSAKGQSGFSLHRLFPCGRISSRIE